MLDKNCSSPLVSVGKRGWAEEMMALLQRLLLGLPELSRMSTSRMFLHFVFVFVLMKHCSSEDVPAHCRDVGLDDL